MQVNGRVRERLEVRSDLSEQEARQIAPAHPRVASLIGDAPTKQVIFVPGKLVNIVVHRERSQQT